MIQTFLRLATIPFGARLTCCLCMCACRAYHWKITAKAQCLGEHLKSQDPDHAVVITLMTMLVSSPNLHWAGVESLKYRCITPNNSYRAKLMKIFLDLTSPKIRNVTSSTRQLAARPTQHAARTRSDTLRPAMAGSATAAIDDPLLLIMGYQKCREGSPRTVFSALWEITGGRRAPAAALQTGPPPIGGL
ncbi:hypothetical protein EVAR_97517_1 [Eumeta japonica]|uniref:Uncharacterized protein n=1 Tax=Eumeta variegata TaxID=151549 RepID=A0A4C1WPL3_EUMVA|nr:hypothetical protein EVAR_97517_1 [Eumeta japonica]